MFRFTIRELVLVTVIVAMGAAWWAERRQLNRELSVAISWQPRAEALEESLQMDGWHIEWDLDNTVLRLTKDNGHYRGISYRLKAHNRQ